MRFSEVFLIPLFILGSVATAVAKPPQSQAKRNGDGECEDYTDYCTRNDVCAYTFVLPQERGPRSCPKIKDTVMNLQTMVDASNNQDREIERLRETNAELIQRIDELEKRFEMRGRRWWGSNRKTKMETSQHIAKLYRKHKWQAKKIRQRRVDIEKLMQLLNVTMPTETEIVSPGLNIHPRPDSDGFITFNPRQGDSFINHVETIDNLLNTYIDDENTITMYDECPPGECPEEDEGRLCHYPISKLGAVCTTPGYGYDKGRPCIYLSLDKIEGWKPKPFGLNQVPEEILDIYRTDFIPITCHIKRDEEEQTVTMGQMLYHPSNGLGVEYFPYTDDDNGDEEIDVTYQTPLVAVHFPSMPLSSPVQVVCKAWAANIDHKKGHGMVKFTLLANRD